MRPKAIRQAEGVFLGAIAMLVAAAVLQWDGLSRAFGAAPVAGATAFSIGLWALLLLFATRRGANWARWALTIVTAFTVLSILWQAAQGQIALGAVGVLNILQAVVAAIGAVLLFRPAANRWFARPHGDWEEDA